MVDYWMQRVPLDHQAVLDDRCRVMAGVANQSRRRQKGLCSELNRAGQNSAPLIKLSVNLEGLDVHFVFCEKEAWKVEA